MQTNLSLQDAQLAVLDRIELLQTEIISTQLAYGRVLAETIVSTRTIPPGDCSAMDGYAIRSKDLLTVANESPISLKLVFEVAAGGTPPRQLETGEVARIFTGAQVPPGADAVVPQEDVKRTGEKIEFTRSVLSGEHVRLAGEDVKDGDQILSHGSILRSPQLGLLASVGRTLVPVVQRPSVAIVSGGDELVEPDRDLRKGGIIASNAYTIAAECASFDIKPRNLGIAEDRPEDLQRLIRSGLNSDVLISTAGVSVGDHDNVRPVLKEMGCDLHFWGVRMKPGFPVLFGSFPNGPIVFGLPGNPVSSLVTFLKLVRPALRKMCGFKNLYLPTSKAVLLESMEKKPGRRHFIRVLFEKHNGRLGVRSTGNQSSGVLRSMATADGLLDFPEEESHLSRGSEVLVHLLKEDFIP